MCQHPLHRAFHTSSGHPCSLWEGGSRRSVCLTIGHLNIVFTQSGKGLPGIDQIAGLFSDDPSALCEHLADAAEMVRGWAPALQSVDSTLYTGQLLNTVRLLEFMVESTRPANMIERAGRAKYKSIHLINMVCHAWDLRDRCKSLETVKRALHKVLTPIWRDCIIAGMEKSSFRWTSVTTIDR